jgi:DNA-binding transcriptional ArsR family regulator
MGLSKTSQYNAEEIKMAKMAKALSHPARIRILNYLNKYSKAELRDLPSLLELAPSTISDHLEWLIDVDLVSVELVGKIGVVFLLSTKELVVFEEEIVKFTLISTQMLTRSERMLKCTQLTKTKGVPVIIRI